MKGHRSSSLIIPLKYPTACKMFAPYLSILVISVGNWAPVSC
jgi:hypothetical protein